MKTILILEDDVIFSRSIGNWLKKKGMATEHATTLSAARKALSAREFDLVLADLRLPDGNSTSLLEWMNERFYATPFLIMTNYGQVENAVEAMQLGAANYLCKPVQPDKLLEAIGKIFSRSRNDGSEFYRGESAKAREMYRLVVQSLGLPVWLPPLMGTVVYGGSLEFVLASLLLGSFAPVSAFLMALMIQARHLFYGLTMLQRYRGYGLRSAYMIFAMSDETFSITCSAEPSEGVDKGWFMFFITLLDQIYWVASAAMGAALGSVLPFSTEGVDFVMTAMFVVIFLNQWEKEKQHASAIIGIAAPLVCLRIFGSGSFLIPSMVCILVALLLFRRPIESKESEAAK